MNKTRRRQLELLVLLRNQGTGVINLSNDQIAALLGVSKRTVARDLDEMDQRDLIIRETSLIKANGSTVKQRDIILKDEPQRRFTLKQHKQLSDIENYKVSTKDWGEVIAERRVDGEWHRFMSMKEFASEKQAWSWIYFNMPRHYKAYTQGERYTNRNQ